MRRFELRDGFYFLSRLHNGLSRISERFNGRGIGRNLKLLFDEKRFRQCDQVQMDAAISHRYRRHDLHRLRPLFQSLLARGHQPFWRR